MFGEPGNSHGEHEHLHRESKPRRWSVPGAVGRAGGWGEVGLEQSPRLGPLGTLFRPPSVASAVS